MVNYVVELTSPAMPGDDLSYSVNAVGGTVLPETTVTCDGASHAFIDTWVGSCDGADGRGWMCACASNGQCDSQNCNCLVGGGAEGAYYTCCLTK